MESNRKGQRAPQLLAGLAAMTVTLGCSDNRLPPNPVPTPEIRRPIPAWFDPNAVWNPNGADSRIYIEGKIVFDTAKHTIRPESAKVLEQLLAFLVAHPEVTRVRIEGHTDSRGGDEYNQSLSARRSLAVADWLVDRGIDHLRLVAVGFGEKKPIAPNELAEGRAENRRTEFHVMEVNGRPFGSATALDGGMVLTVLSAEERERLRNPPKVELATPEKFVPTGDEIRQAKPAETKKDPENTYIAPPPGAEAPPPKDGKAPAAPPKK
jgi:outer membrane protein OmpA-like peptidoglycan-associated protein